jgi:hypothetical protein
VLHSPIESTERELIHTRAKNSCGAARVALRQFCLRQSTFCTATRARPNVDLTPFAVFFCSFFNQIFPCCNNAIRTILQVITRG